MCIEVFHEWRNGLKSKGHTKDFGHKSTLAVPKEIFVLSGSTWNCNLINLPNLNLPNKSQYPCPNPTGLSWPGSTWGHLTPVYGPITYCQITNFKSYQNLMKYIFGPLKFTCAGFCDVSVKALKYYIVWRWRRGCQKLSKISWRHL